MDDNFKKFFISILVVSIFVSSLFGAAAGFWAGSSVLSGGAGLKGVLSDIFKGGDIRWPGTAEIPAGGKTVITVTEESAVISAVEKVSPAVVSIIISKDLPRVGQFGSPFDSDFFRRFFGDGFDFEIPDQSGRGGTERREIGGGTGFIVSGDGYIVTNKHVVSDESADYTVLMNDGTRYPAKVLARDPLNDLAILKVEADKALPTVELGDSSGLKAGQTVIAIGNALGEFRNTVSTGVISGLARSITAAGAGIGSEELVGVIQTDASINPGNSGGPLLNIAGQVIGINTAIAQGAQNIGFAIPINEAKNTIESVKKTGRIVRPWLGIRYVIIDKTVAEGNQLSVDYGALVLRGENRTDLAVIPGSPADKAGIMENDIILEVNGAKIDADNPLAKAIAGFKVGDEIALKMLRKGEEKEIKVKLEEMK